MMGFASLTVALTAAAAAPEAKPADVYAVVVGYNGGLRATEQRPALPSLRFADDDALRMARWFQALAAEGDVAVLTELDEPTRATLAMAGLTPPEVRSPTRTHLFAALDALKARLAVRPKARPAVVYVFYAGHGLAGRLLLQPEGGEEAALTGHELKLKLLELDADRIEVFVDACRSQSLFTERGAGPDFSSEIAALEEKGRTAAFGVLAASQSDKPAGEASDLMGGFFSHVLASGLAGAADADGNEVVSFGELAAFVAFNTERLTGQRPWFSPPGGDLRAPVVDLHGATRLRLPTDSEGRVRVSSPTGVPVFAEVNKPKGRQVRLALPAGRYQVLQRLDAQRALAGSVELLAGEERDLPALDEAVAVSRIAERGDVDWQELSFLAPFSSEVVAALDAGYASAQPNRSAPRARPLAVDGSYSLGPAPFGLAGLEHGGELGARYHFGWLMLGARVAFRTTGQLGAASEPAALRRLGAEVQAGARFLLLGERLGLTPSVGVGFKTVWFDASGASAADPAAPAIAAGARAEIFLARLVSVWLDGRLEVEWVNFDGIRLAFAQPTVRIGVSLWP